MVDATRALLDELMGKERNVPLTERSNRRIKFTDPEVCKYNLCTMCPNQLFKNTRSDLGPCGYEIHEDHLEWEQIKADWDKLDERDKDRYGYERDLVAYLQQLIRDMDRKIEKAKERAHAESAPKPLKPDDKARLADLEARMKVALDNAARLGEAGDVDASMAAASQADAMKRQLEVLQRQLTAPDRTMEVCDICGVFINSTDNDQRRMTQANMEHLTGKQYLGWKRIRETFAELTKKAEAKASSRHERHREPEHVRSRSRGHGDERGHRDERGPREERGHRDERPRGRDERYERGYRDRERSPRREPRNDYARDRNYERRNDFGGGSRRHYR